MARCSFCCVLLCAGAAVLAAFFLPRPAYGQATELGNITGTVVDPQSAAVPGVKVTVVNRGTQVSRDTATDNEGNFAVRSLVPGTYRVEVNARGFEKQVQEVKLDVGLTATVDFRLAVGQVTQSVEVNALASVLQTEESSVGTVVENSKIQELPLNGRNFNTLTRLVPGAVRGTNGGGETIQGETFAVTGSRSDNTYYALDGMYNNGTFFKTAAIHPSVDGIQEFRIQSNSSAQYGAAAGANIDVVTKSGTNELHGTVYEFVRNDKFDSREYFATSRPAFRRNQFGFAVGGPVVIPKVYSGKNRTFWFFSYEGMRERRGSPQFLTIPTPAMIAGDLSKTLTGDPASQIYDPATGRVVCCDAKGQPMVVRDPFPGNIIPSDRIKPYATAYAKLWFPTNLIPKSPNFINTAKRSEDDDQITVRIDQRISASNNLFGRVSWSSLNRSRPASMPTAFTGTYNRYAGVVLSDTHVFNPTLILNLRAGYLRNNLGEGPTERFINVYRQAGLTNTPLSFRNFDYPINFGIAGFSGPGLGNLVNGPDFIYQGSVSLSKTLGKHTLTFGYDYTRLRIFHDSVFSTFNFDNVPTADPQNVATTGQALASFLLGLPSRANRIVGQTDLDIRHDLHHGYIQDDFRATRRLTLNLGLRYEYNQWPHHIRGRLSGFDMLTGRFMWASTNPITGQPANVRPEIADPRFKNFAPRIGFAYRLTDKTSLRSSYGIFYNSNFSWEWSSSRGGWPFSVSDNLTALNRGTNLQPVETLFLSFDPKLVTPQTQHTVSRDAKTAYMQNWNLGIERQVAQDLLVELNYQGSKGTHLSSFLSTNDPPPGPGDANAVNARRPYPVAGAISELKTIATSKYHALTAKVEKRYAKGLSVLASYAWSHSIDLNSEFGGSSPQDNRNIRADLANSGFDQRHVATISYSWELPFGKGMSGVGKYVLGGWEVAGIHSFETGRVFNIILGFDNANVGARGNFQRPNLVGNPFPAGFHQTAGPNGLWFNTAAFAAPPQYTFGNLGRNAFHGPSYLNTDFGLLKKIILTERVGLQFRSEFFNLFNNTNFGNPVGNGRDGNFGKVLSMASLQREIQFGLKLIY